MGEKEQKQEQGPVFWLPEICNKSFRWFGKTLWKFPKPLPVDWRAKAPALIQELQALEIWGCSKRSWNAVTDHYHQNHLGIY